MIRQKAKDLMQKLDFPNDAQMELLSSLEELLKTPDFLDIIKQYENDNFDFDVMLSDTKTLAEKCGISPYSAYMLLFICMSERLHKLYSFTTPLIIVLI